MQIFNTSVTTVPGEQGESFTKIKNEFVKLICFC